MSYKLVLHKEAGQDIEEPIDWYSKQLDGLGNQFYAQLTDKLEKLKENPKLWSVRYDEVHCVIVNVFPYLIHYIIEESEKKVVVLGVFHTSKDPDNWRIRKKD